MNYTSFSLHQPLHDLRWPNTWEEMKPTLRQYTELTKFYKLQEMRQNSQIRIYRWSDNKQCHCNTEKKETAQDFLSLFVCIFCIVYSLYILKCKWNTIY